MQQETRDILRKETFQSWWRLQSCNENWGSYYALLHPAIATLNIQRAEKVFSFSCSRRWFQLGLAKNSY